jgi:predicted DNA-binding ribbon-helix-helix protein
MRVAKTITGMVPKNPKPAAEPTGSISRRRIQSEGKRISISLEDEFWDAFGEIAKSLRTTPSNLLARALVENPGTNHSSAVRLFVLAHFRRLAGKNDLIG